MNIVTGVIAVFSVIGALDRIIGNRFGLGKEFERGFEMLGALTFAMLGMIVISPVIASWLQPALDFLPVEPSMVMGALFACDSGGAHLAAQVARDPVMGYYNGLIVASMMGCTVSFTIPFALNVVDKQHHKEVLLGLLCGIVTIPVGCAISGVILKMPLTSLGLNLLPLLIFSVVIAFGLAKFPDACVKIFGFLGNIIKIIITIGLVLAVIKLLTGIEVLKGTASVEDGIIIIFNAAVVMTGAFPLIHILARILAKPLGALGKVLKINGTSVTGLVSTLATSITTFDMVKDMDKKGVVINSAFAVSAAFVFTDHLAFTIAFQSGYLVSMIVGKLISAVLAVAVAGVVYNKMYKGE